LSAHLVLDELCERYGIAPGYQDIWGRTHTLDERTRRALLAAMGVDTARETDLATTLQRLEERDWTRLIPSIEVLWEGSELLTLPVCLPPNDVGQTLRWRLLDEVGSVREGEQQIAELPVIAEREIEGQLWRRRTLELAAPGTLGYYRLQLEVAGRQAETTLVLAPRHCFQPAALEGEGRVWGFSAQLYSVRSARNWGIGDFTDLSRLLGMAADAGAAMVGVNPLHALFPHNPEHASPYSPSSRLFLNVLYLDVEAVPHLEQCTAARERLDSDEFQARLRALRAAELVDYEGVAAAKLEILELLYEYFRANHLRDSSVEGRDFRQFQEQQGEPLRRQALHDALQAHFHSEDASVWGWPAWPPAYQEIGSREVAAFASAERERIEFYQYLQWLASGQLAAAGRRSGELGLAVGIYQDLAVGTDSGSGEVWGNPALFARDLRIGSPPDEHNPLGQDWGLPPWNPVALREAAYQPFVDTLRHNMAHAGALRIDHVMALERLYCIPVAGGPADGGYVHYPFDELRAILALESVRNHCLVIGEDLGTVTDSVRAGLAELGVLSYRVAYFEKDSQGAFRSPEEYPRQALVAVSTHDLPTLAGFWAGTDLALREQLQLFPDRARYEQHLVGRAEDRTRLLLALERAGVLPAEGAAALTTLAEMSSELAVAVHVYLARTPCCCMLVQLEDLLGQVEQVNLPGSVNEYPNWRRRLALELEHWGEEPRVNEMLSALREERGIAATPQTASPAGKLSGLAVIPSATYRLQLHAGFGFDDAAAQIDYLARLGVSHCYCSPYLAARPGSGHGYDIIDHDSLNPELGGKDGFKRFCEALAAHNIAQILDVVPNHMGVMGRDNRWWLDVLENGQASAHAHYFDINWIPLKDELRGKVLLPVLGDYYGNVLERGELTLAYDREAGAFSVIYYEHCFPVDPREYPRILGRRVLELAARMDAANPALAEFQSLLTAFDHLPPRNASDREAIAERARDKEILKRRLAELCRSQADLAHYLEELLGEYNGHAGIPPDTVLMHELLEAQAYRLAFWRVAGDQINYRRFFDINELAGLRMESPEVFEATHALVMALVAEGQVQGLRIDHPDGLYDPAGYFSQLQRRVAELGGHTGASDAESRPLYLLVEKILAEGEPLRKEWPVHGTTGYDFADHLSGLLVDPEGETALDACYAEFLGDASDLHEILYRSKVSVMEESLASELNVLAQELDRIAEADPHTRDFTQESLHRALREVVACFPVYRTYIAEEGPDALDRHYIDVAIAAARHRGRAVGPVFDFVREVLLTTVAEGKPDAYREQVLRFAMRFQQYTGPVTAKGVEDTAFYRYHRLVSLNEVGGEPERFGRAVEELHRACIERQREWPHAMLSLSTHDSKRAEDVRARLHVLSELPGDWREAVRQWTELNRAHKSEIDGVLWPDRNSEYLLYQTLLGAWPLTPLESAEERAEFQRRIQAYMLKAAREAKVHTSWLNPDANFEEAQARFIAALLNSESGAAFQASLLPLQRRLARLGLFNSLSQTLLKLTLPGVPDTYQGTELWDFSLVDPDNRRPVDYQRRRELLEGLQQDFPEGGDWQPASQALLQTLEDGRIKLYLCWRVLSYRRERPWLFRDGDYLPLSVQGARAMALFAFARQRGDDFVLVAVPRLVGRHLGGDEAATGTAFWRDTRVLLPTGLTGRACFDLLSGIALVVEQVGGGPSILVGEWLRHLPFGMARPAGGESES
jgi:(1->4)-alpha-D-glucan 1-alpha-D-glucosylmutase